MRHVRAFDVAVFQRLHAGAHLVLVAADLRGNLDVVRNPVVFFGEVEGNLFGIVHILYDDVALGAADGAAAVAADDRAGMHVRLASVSVVEAEALALIHAGIHELHAGFHTHNVVAEEHGAEIERIHAHI